MTIDRLMRNTRGQSSLPKIIVLVSTLALIGAFILPVSSAHASDSASVVAAAIPLRTFAPPAELTATDHVYDNGSAVDLQWSLSPDDQITDADFPGYAIYRRGGDSAFTKIAEIGPQMSFYADDGLTPKVAYVYRIDVKDGMAGPESAAVTPDSEWFNGNLAWAFVFLILICGVVMAYIYTARRGKKVFVRKIAGLEAIEEAIGRATEMGRPILYIPGMLDMDDVQTLAGLTILGKVAEKIAEYETKILVPTRASLVMTAAREIVKNSFSAAGRPDSFVEDNIFYLTDEQFGYVAGVNGIMMREKPATCFYLGAFFAESLILAENGNSIGAIQIAGTAQPAQLPFFVAACDYTLIGEEMFAASAYLSAEPRQLGSLKGQDFGKALAMTAIVLGTLAATLGDGFGVAGAVEVKTFIISLFTAGN